MFVSLFRRSQGPETVRQKLVQVLKTLVPNGNPEAALPNAVELVHMMEEAKKVVKPMSILRARLHVYKLLCGVREIRIRIHALSPKESNWGKRDLLAMADEMVTSKETASVAVAAAQVFYRRQLAVLERTRQRLEQRNSKRSRATARQARKPFPPGPVAPVNSLV